MGKGTEGVDYAVLERGQPIWLIEVKSAQTDLPNQLTPQLKRYAVDTRSRFASLTNGVDWHWYMWSDNRGLEETPFLKIDVRRHPTDLDGEATTMSNALSTMPNLGTGTHTDDSGEPVEGGNSRTLKARYRIIGQDWIECKNATRLMLDIIKWCAENHKNGIDDYYNKLSLITIHCRPFLREDGSNDWDGLPSQEKRFYAKESVNGWRMFRNLSNKQKSERIAEILATCRKRDGACPVQGRDLWIEMPNVKCRTS
ncbi:MAG TPA: hypothetical protein DD643_05315 [Synechococcus sp. UBA8638]|nr:hypothetical protein [Synechococcus sp. UBA8638]